MNVAVSKCADLSIFSSHKRKVRTNGVSFDYIDISEKGGNSGSKEDEKEENEFEEGAAYDDAEGNHVSARKEREVIG